MFVKQLQNTYFIIKIKSSLYNILFKAAVLINCKSIIYRLINLYYSFVMLYCNIRNVLNLLGKRRGRKLKCGNRKLLLTYYKTFLHIQNGSWEQSEIISSYQEYIILEGSIFVLSQIGIDYPCIVNLGLFSWFTSFKSSLESYPLLVIFSYASNSRPKRQI